MPRIPAAGVAALGLVLLAAGPAAAQDLDQLRDEVRENAKESDFADQLLALTGFAALPGIASATFNLDDDYDTRIQRINLPLSRQFDQVDVLGGKLYGELTLGYMDLNQEATVEDGTALATRVKSGINNFSAIGGAGIGYGVAEGTTLTPIVMFGYSKIKENATLSGPLARSIEDVADGIIINFEIEEYLYGAALKLDYERTYGRDINFAGNLRYSYLWSQTISTSDKSLDDGASFGVGTAGAVFDGPTGQRAFGRELRWIGFGSASGFPGLSSKALEMDYFVEIGAGLEIVDRDVISGIEGASLRASYITGDDVTGFSIGATLEF